MNVKDGFFGELALMNVTPKIVSDYKFNTVKIDGRVYRTVKKQGFCSAGIWPVCER